jgi:hypothetical protein
VVIWGGLPSTRVIALDIFPDCVSLTAIETLDALAVASEDISEVTSSELTKDVVCCTPFHRITDRFEKFNPLTANMKAGCVEAIRLGVRLNTCAALACGSEAGPAETAAQPNWLRKRTMAQIKNPFESDLIFPPENNLRKR